MKNFLFFWLGIFLIPLSLTAQPSLKPITGIVVSDGEPFPGATILIKNTSKGTTTDINGFFMLEASPGDTLIFSAIGLVPQEVVVGLQWELHIELSADVAQLNEVVVIGYGTSRRRDLTGAVDKVDPVEVKNMPVASFDAQLQGKAAGVQINSITGMPGESVKIRVRGSTSINASNDPLYIIDGVFVTTSSLSTIDLNQKETSPLADISPADIESIEVLKDASATAIYGARGANGVIIITTKRGKYEMKPTLNFNYSYGQAAVQKSRLWGLTTGPEHATIVNEMWINSGIDNPALNRTYENRPFRPVSEGGRGLPEEQQTYDRLRHVWQTAELKNYDLSLTGGNSNTRYYIGASYTDQDAVVKPAYFQRASLKLNLDQKVSDKITVGVSNGVYHTFRNQVRVGNGPDAGIFQAALQTPTYLPENDEAGNPLKWGTFDNAQVLVENYDVQSISNRYIGNLYGEAELLPNLKFRSSWSVDYSVYDENEYFNNKMKLGAPPINGRASSSLTRKLFWSNEQTLSYRTTLGDGHNLGALVGNTVQSETLSNTSAFGQNFPNNSFTQISAAAIRTSEQSWTKGNLASFFSRLDYNFNQKYYLDLTIRADGSSRFGEGNRWGYFPSVGAAWTISEEKFLQQSAWLSTLKLRASYGLTGNQNGINNFAARGYWSGSAGYPDVIGAADNAGTAPIQLANPSLKWETTAQANLGVDVGLWADRLSLTLNLYSKYTSDALLYLPVSNTTGFSTYLDNAGEISNKGYEVAITSVNVETNKLRWTTSFNIAGNVNKVEKLDVPITFYSRDWLRVEEGYPLYSFWLYRQLYVDPATGDAVFDDVDKDGAITVADRQIVGNAMPKFFGGLTNSFRYKSFDLNVFFSYQYGNQIINYNRFLGESGGVLDNSRFLLASQLDRWTKPGDITNVPRVTSVGDNYRIETSTRFQEDGSFIRLKSLSLGYTLNRKLPVWSKIKSLRVYVNATNVFILTNYSGPDPEVSVTSDQNAPGLDQATTPQPRSIQFGLNLTL